MLLFLIKQYTVKTDKFRYYLLPSSAAVKLCEQEQNQVWFENVQLYRILCGSILIFLIGIYSYFGIMIVFDYSHLHCWFWDPWEKLLILNEYFRLSSSFFLVKDLVISCSKYLKKVWHYFPMSVYTINVIYFALTFISQYKKTGASRSVMLSKVD